MSVPRVYNFSSGPAVLPVPVLEQMQRDLVALPGVGMSVLGLRGRDRLAPWLVLVGLAVLTTLTVVWLNGPATIADRALARAEAIALVDRVPLQPVPPVRIGAGLVLGVLGALLVSAVGIRAAWHSPAE